MKNPHTRRAEAVKAEKAPVDPLKVFMNAERFRIADITLRQVQNQHLAMVISGPALVLSAFASELYLKCLICIETGKLEFGHELRILFKKLSNQSKRGIEGRWNAAVATPERQRVFAAIRQLTGQSVFEDLDWALENGGDGFVELRYIHEGDIDTKFLLGDFPKIMRDEILVSKPEWANLVHGPSKPIPGFGPGEGFPGRRTPK